MIRAIHIVTDSNQHIVLQGGSAQLIKLFLVERWHMLCINSSVIRALATQFGDDEKIAIDIPSRIFGNPDSERGLEGVYPDIPQYIGKVTDSEMFVPLERTTDALNIIQRQLRDEPILVFVFLRFVKKSSSTLSAAMFNTTTTIDMISIQDEGLFSRTSGWFERLFVEFETSGIPHSYHWGKHVIPLNNRWVPNAYGEALTEWQNQRRVTFRKFHSAATGRRKAPFANSRPSFY